MDEPKFIPDRNIRDNDNRPIKDADNLRPRNNNPFTVDRNTVTIRFVFNPAIPVESLKMIRPNNVDSITVTYISPRNSRPKPVVEDEKPQKLVRFPQQPYAVEVVIKVTRDDRNEPMSFQVSIWACYEVVTETTPSVPTASSPSTTSVVSTSSVYTSAPSSSSSYTGSTSSSSPYTSTPSSSSVHTGSTSSSPTYTSSMSLSSTSSSPSVHTPSTSSGWIRRAFTIPDMPECRVILNKQKDPTRLKSDSVKLVSKRQQKDPYSTSSSPVRQHPYRPLFLVYIFIELSSSVTQASSTSVSTSVSRQQRYLTRQRV
ncbi:uncharacterized protein LOC128546814 [Mercenaria mercenaria]|uniref:uncharacterized protein LOC128546814 n=1 Tax=Mercenaria mercenaria TaxID=6596 RepID=UPI00234EE4A2|nr:uncharacterized protein LOC128546814 [Mercenaria mercenaria]